MRASKWANERLIYLSFEKKLHYTLEGFIMIFVIYGRPVVCRVWLCFHLSDARTYIFSHSVRIFWFNIWISFNAGRQCLLHFFFFFLIWVIPIVRDRNSFSGLWPSIGFVLTYMQSVVICITTNLLNITHGISSNISDALIAILQVFFSA